MDGERRYRLTSWGVALAAAMLAAVGSTAPTQSPVVHLRNVAAAAGLRFIHSDSPAAGKYFVDSAPGGVAVFDYNGDGRPDIRSSRTAPRPPGSRKRPGRTGIVCIAMMGGCTLRT